MQRQGPSNTLTPSEIASINGVALNAADEALSADDLRQRACSELLRQAAVAEGLLPPTTCRVPTASSAKPRRRPSKPCSNES
jgi:hypothetical protein